MASAPPKAPPLGVNTLIDVQHSESEDVQEATRRLLGQLRQAIPGAKTPVCRLAPEEPAAPYSVTDLAGSTGPSKRELAEREARTVPPPHALPPALHWPPHTATSTSVPQFYARQERANLLEEEEEERSSSARGRKAAPRRKRPAVLKRMTAAEEASRAAARLVREVLGTGSTQSCQLRLKLRAPDGADLSSLLPLEMPLRAGAQRAPRMDHRSRREEAMLQARPVAAAPLPASLSLHLSTFSAAAAAGGARDLAARVRGGHRRPAQRSVAAAAQRRRGWREGLAHARGRRAARRAAAAAVALELRGHLHRALAARRAVGGRRRELGHVGGRAGGGRRRWQPAARARAHADATA